MPVLEDTRLAQLWAEGALSMDQLLAYSAVCGTGLDTIPLPGDISASERYYAEDIVDPPVTVTPKGTIAVPTGPGIGYTVVERRLSLYSVRKEYVLS